MAVADQDRSLSVVIQFVLIGAVPRTQSSAKTGLGRAFESPVYSLPTGITRDLNRSPRASCFAVYVSAMSGTYAILALSVAHQMELRTRRRYPFKRLLICVTICSAPNLFFGMTQAPLVIQLAQARKANRQSKRGYGALRVPWHKMPSTRRREILIPETTSIQGARPIRSETRATLVASIARGRRWLDELITNLSATTESIAERERCSARKINMTISLAFLAPNLVKAAVEGRLPHGMGVVRLCDLPAEWSRQHQVLGLTSQ